MIMEKEIWKDIPDYEGIYQVSSYGRVRTAENKTTYTERHGIRHWKQRIIKYKGETYKTGYRVSLWKNGKPKDWLVARLVAITFLGKSDLTVNHIDGNRFNNHIENLEWCSLKENIQKGFETGLYHCKKVAVFNKETGETTIHISMARASRYMENNSGYIYWCNKRGKTENAKYSWRLLEEKEV